MERTGDGDDNNHDGNDDHGGVDDQWIPRMFSIPIVFLSCSFLFDVLNSVAPQLAYRLSKTVEDPF